MCTPSVSGFVAFGDHEVSFCWRDYSDGGAQKVMTVDAVEFLRRFLLHVLPKGFVRIRHYGLHAPRNVGDKLADARALLTGRPAPTAEPPQSKSSQPWAKIVRGSGSPAAIRKAGQ